MGLNLINTVFSDEDQLLPPTIFVIRSFHIDSSFVYGGVIEIMRMVTKMECWQ